MHKAVQRGLHKEKKKIFVQKGSHFRYEKWQAADGYCKGVNISHTPKQSIRDWQLLTAVLYSRSRDFWEKSWKALTRWFFDGQLFAGMRESSEEGNKVFVKVTEGLAETSHRVNLSVLNKLFGEAGLTHSFWKHVTSVSHNSGGRVTKCSEAEWEEDQHG